MRPLRSVLAVWQPAAAIADDPLSHLRAQWATIVGEDIAANSRPAELIRGSLLVVTRSSAWSQQLSFLSERIVETVRAATGVTLEGVRFRVGRITNRGRAPAERKTARAQEPRPPCGIGNARIRGRALSRRRHQRAAGQSRRGLERVQPLRDSDRSRYWAVLRAVHQRAQRRALGHHRAIAFRSALSGLLGNCRARRESFTERIRNRAWKIARPLVGRAHAAAAVGTQTGRPSRTRHRELVRSAQDRARSGAHRSGGCARPARRRFIRYFLWK